MRRNSIQVMWTLSQLKMGSIERLGQTHLFARTLTKYFFGSSIRDMRLRPRASRHFVDVTLFIFRCHFILVIKRTCLFMFIDKDWRQIQLKLQHLVIWGKPDSSIINIFCFRAKICHFFSSYSNKFNARGRIYSEFFLFIHIELIKTRLLFILF